MDPNQTKRQQLIHCLAELSYRYQQTWLDYNTKRLIDYGTGELYSPVEVHMVSQIEESPGITATQIAQSTRRTKSAISQMLSKLEARGLIRREKNLHNAKQQLLYVTPKGLELSKCHRAYDEQAFPLDDLIALFGYDALEKFTAIMDYMARRTLDSLYGNTEPAPSTDPKKTTGA